MFKKEFGKRKPMCFKDESEYYETLGFLAKSNKSTELYLESNQFQGAWAHEGRINCYFDLVKFTTPLQDKFTIGKGKGILHRINCTEFILDLINTHNFAWGFVQDAKAIKNTIPPAFHNDFDNGLKR